MARQLGSIVRQTRAFVNRQDDERQKASATCAHLGDREDHISNSKNAARHAWQILRNVERDRLMYPDLERGAELVRNGRILGVVQEALGGLLE
jgi:histidine ammonia-lyase